MNEDSSPEPEDSGSPRSGLPFPLIGAAVGVVVVAIVLGAFVFSGGDGGSSSSATPTPRANAGLSTFQPTAVATLDINRATAETSDHLAEVGADDRLVIPRFNVDAPLTHRTVGTDGVMPDPEGPDDVAYYDFSAWPGKGGAPGLGGNGVFAGHVDSGHRPCNNGAVPPPCEAVFWDISLLALGDEVEVHLDGVVHRYSVTSNEPINATAGPWDQIVSATAEESITLITCGGEFIAGEYTNRQVVTAVRIT